MGTTITLQAKDGFELSAYRAEPQGKARGGVVILQEIFGVNTHIKDVCERYAKQGYLAVAPALFDRAQPGVDLGYESADVEQGRKLKAGSPLDRALLDVEAAIQAASEAGRVAVIGYCWGGSLAYAAATRLDGLSAAIVYYGGEVAKLSNEKPKVPTLAHFGETDASIPLSDVDKLRAAQPEVEVHLYGAGHGFSCDMRGAYHAPSAALALERTLAWLSKYVD